MFVMKRNTNTMTTRSRRLRNNRGAVLPLIATAALAFLSGGTSIAGGDRPFSRIVSFGDSLSDIGNFFAASGKTLPPVPYHQGRFSNGIIWTEHLAASLGIPIDPADQYAWGGALTGDLNLNSNPAAAFILPGFQQEVDAYLSDVGAAGADPDALHAVWIGSNDFLLWLQLQNQPPDQLIMTGVANTVAGLGALADKGARHFVVGNMPDLGLTPAARALGPGVAALLTELSAAWNQVLASQLAALEQDLDIRITPLDAFFILNELSSNPAEYGLTNVVDPALDSYPSVDPDTYLFWDGVHPTTVGHELTAGYVCLELLQTYRPERAVGRGPQILAALNGRVVAASR